MRYIFGKILLLGTLAISGMADYYEDAGIADYNTPRKPNNIFPF